MIPLERNPLYALSQTLYDWCMRRARELKTLESVRPTALDIGANDGGYSSKLIENGYLVHAFEPVPDMFEKLSKRFRFTPSIRCHRIALSDSIGELKGVQVHVAWTLAVPGSTSLSICPSYVGRPTFDVETYTVDHYVEKSNIGVHLIKLDVDGYEPKVLRGAVQTLKKFKPPILCELACWPERIGEDSRKFIEHIFSLEYAIVSMDGKNVFTSTSWPTIDPCFPHDTSFDVMLIPHGDWLTQLIEKFNPTIHF